MGGLNLTTTTSQNSKRELFGRAMDLGSLALENFVTY